LRLLHRPPCDARRRAERSENRPAPAPPSDLETRLENGHAKPETIRPPSRACATRTRPEISRSSPLAHLVRLPPSDANDQKLARTFARDLLCPLPRTI